jgi:CubicO group peptidase (beta-lactamase class C family)
MAELVFDPAGMQRTTLRPSMAMTYPLAMGHAVNGSEPPAIIRPAFNNVAQWPAGSIYSNLDDLSRFVSALMNGGRHDGQQILAPEVAAKLAGKYIAMPGDPNVHYGYGLLNFEDRGVRIWMHGGFSRGYGSMIQMAPDQRFAVIVLTNRSGETMLRTRNKAMEMFLQLKKENTEPPKQRQPMTTAEMAAYSGKYVNGPQVWEIAVKENKLQLKGPDGQSALLEKTGPNRLSYGDGLEADLILVPNEKGAIEYVFDGLYSAGKQ